MEESNHRIIMVDCQLSGISGDMILGALIGTGADASLVKEAIESVKTHVSWCKEINVSIRDVMKGEFKAKAVEIGLKESPPQKGKGRPSTHLREAVNNSTAELKLSSDARTFASKVIETLIEAERGVHAEAAGSEPELHELGSTDTIADVVGVAAALDSMKAFTKTTIHSTPVAVGGGLYRFSHGILQSPGPVALEILRKFSFPLVGGPVDAELVTPTGASLLVNMAKHVDKFYPEMRPTVIGYGAARKDLGDVPNMLRIIIGNPIEHGLLTDKVYVLETNIDDVEGETVGYLMERLLAEKARDVCIIPAIMKKSRPGQILKVIVEEEDVERISRIMIDETGSLGIRAYPVKRYIASRQIVPIELSIDGSMRRVNVKVGKTKSGEVVTLKPEYEDVRSISIETKKAFRDIEELAKREARKKIIE